MGLTTRLSLSGPTPPAFPGAVTRQSMAETLQTRLLQLYAPLARKSGMEYTAIVSLDLNFVQLRGGGANFSVSLRAGKQMRAGKTLEAAGQKYLAPLISGDSPLFTKAALNAAQGIVTGEYCGLLVTARISFPRPGTTALQTGDWVQISGMIYRKASRI